MGAAGRGDSVGGGGGWLSPQPPSPPALPLSRRWTAPRAPPTFIRQLREPRLLLYDKPYPTPSPICLLSPQPPSPPALPLSSTPQPREPRPLLHDSSASSTHFYTTNPTPPLLPTPNARLAMYNFMLQTSSQQRRRPAPTEARFQPSPPHTTRRPLLHVKFTRQDAMEDGNAQPDRFARAREPPTRHAPPLSMLKLFTTNHTTATEVRRQLG
jgi:hypothetical protein